MRLHGWQHKGTKQPQEVVLQGLEHNFGYLLVPAMTSLMQSQLSNQVMTQFLYLGLQLLAIKWKNFKMKHVTVSGSNRAVLYLEVNLYLCSIKTLHGGPSLARYPVLFILDNLQNVLCKSYTYAIHSGKSWKMAVGGRDPRQRACPVLI